MKIVFMGTPDFAALHLKTLLEHPDKFQVSAVYTQPDKPKGRSGTPTPSPVKELALQKSLPVIQVQNLKDPSSWNTLKEFEPDLLIVVAFGMILPPAVLAIPKYGAINIHASLLPQYRGASPIHQTLLNGDEETGVTSMLLDSGVDTGNILRQKKITVSLQEDYASLLKRLSELGPECLLETLNDLSTSEVPFRGLPQQQVSAPSYARKISKEMALLDFSKSALLLHNQIRALNLWPVCHITLPINGKSMILKIYKSEALPHCSLCSKGELGVVTLCTRDQLHISTGEGCLRLLEVQLEGKKRMPVAAFLNGTPLISGPG